MCDQMKITSFPLLFPILSNYWAEPENEERKKSECVILNPLAVSFTIARKRAQLLNSQSVKTKDLQRVFFLVMPFQNHEKERNRIFLRRLEKWNANWSEHCEFWNSLQMSGGKLCWVRCPLVTRRQKNRYRSLGKRGGEREREKGEVMGPHLNKGMIFFYLVRCLGSWVFRRKIFLFALGSGVAHEFGWSVAGWRLQVRKRGGDLAWQRGQSYWTRVLGPPRGHGREHTNRDNMIKNNQRQQLCIMTTLAHTQTHILHTHKTHPFCAAVVIQQAKQ